MGPRLVTLQTQPVGAGPQGADRLLGRGHRAEHERPGSLEGGDELGRGDPEGEARRQQAVRPAVR